MRVEQLLRMLLGETTKALPQDNDDRVNNNSCIHEAAVENVMFRSSSWCEKNNTKKKEESLYVYGSEDTVLRSFSLSSPLQRERKEWDQS